MATEMHACPLLPLPANSVISTANTGPPTIVDDVDFGVILVAGKHGEARGVGGASDSCS